MASAMRDRGAPRRPRVCAVLHPETPCESCSRRIMSATTPAEAGAGGSRLWLMDSPLLPYDDDTPGVASTEKPAYGLAAATVPHGQQRNL